MEVKQSIQEKSASMLTAEPKEVPLLAQELQRLRVSMLMLREIVEDIADPNTYREISLLNKMMTGLDPEEDAKRREQQQGEMDAQERMTDAGLDPERAGSIVRVLESLKSVMESQSNGRARLDPAAVLADE